MKKRTLSLLLALALCAGLLVVPAGAKEGETVHIATAAGDMMQLEGEYEKLPSLIAFKDYIFAGWDNGWDDYGLHPGCIFDLNGKKVADFASSEPGYDMILIHTGADNEYGYLYDLANQKGYGPAIDFRLHKNNNADKQSRDDGRSFCYYEALDGNRQYLWGRELDGSASHYSIRNNDAGKPTVCYGNSTDGWTPVIEFYKNNMYYNEIKELGEGYYACRYNTTWYLVHAD